MVMAVALLDRFTQFSTSDIAPLNGSFSRIRVYRESKTYLNSDLAAFSISPNQVMDAGQYEVLHCQITPIQLKGVVETGFGKCVFSEQGINAKAGQVESMENFV
jgi:hypothetical protein